MMEAFFAVQEESGIPVSTGVAQVIAESGFGLYGPGGDNGQGLSQLAYEYKNLFGIKYFSGDKYAIGGVDMSTGEETGNDGGIPISGFLAITIFIKCSFSAFNTSLSIIYLCLLNSFEISSLMH